MKNEISLCKNHIVPDENVPESQINLMGQLHFSYVYKEYFYHNSYFIINFKLLKGHMVLDNTDILFKNQSSHNNSEYASLISFSKIFTTYSSHYLYVAKNISKQPFASICHTCSKPVPKKSILILLLICGDTGALINPGPSQICNICDGNVNMKNNVFVCMECDNYFHKRCMGNEKNVGQFLCMFVRK